MKLAILLGIPAVALLSQVDGTAPGVGPFANTGQAVIALLVIAVPAAVQVFNNISQARREIRQRTWLIEDREHAAKLAQNLRVELLEEQRVTHDKIDENTAISQRAVDASISAAASSHAAEVVANNVNLKLIGIGEARLKKDKVDATSQKRRAGDVIEEIQGLVEGSE